MRGSVSITAEEALKHTDWVWKLARALVATPEGAADLAQDAWEAALERDEAPQGELRAWLTGVLRNLTAMRARSQARRLHHEAAAEAPRPTPAPDELVERLETQQLVAKLVLELAEPVRLVLFLRYYEGLSATEIGARLGIPPGTVRWRLKCGVDELRVRLDQTFDGGRERWMGLLVPALPRPEVAGLLKGALLVKANQVVVVVLGALLAMLLGAWWWWPKPEAAALASTVERASGERAWVGGGAARGPGVTPASEPSVLPAWLAQPDAPPRRVAGRVLSGGQPVSGALVRLEPQPLPLGLRARELRTAADGAFDFGVQPALGHVVSAALPGRTGAVVEVDLRDPSAVPAPEALELVLTGCDARVVGHVLDSSGGPIEHARVRPARGAGVESAARGEFELCLPPGENSLQIDAEGYGALKLTVLVLGRTPRDVVLTPEAFIVGRVVTHETGAPVAGALVVATPGQYMGRESTLGGMVFSGPDGRFRLPVAPGDYRVVASSADASSPSLSLVAATVGRLSDEVVLRLRQGMEIRGHVRSRGKAIAGAHVVALPTVGGSGGVFPDAFSQPDGSFVIAGVRPGEVQFTATPFAVVSPKRFTVAKPKETVELEVTRQASLRGLVTREAKPVAGARVAVSAGLFEFVGRSDAAGRYLLPGLPAGRYRLFADSAAAGAFVSQSGLALADGEARTLDLELSSAASIAGRVVSAEGKPVPGALVIYTQPQSGDEGQSVTDAEGHFRCTQMSGGGEYWPKVFLSESARAPYQPAGDPFPSTKLTDGAAHVEGVTLAINSERLHLSGRVVDVEGTPVPDVRVRAEVVTPGAPPRFRRWEALPLAISDAQGDFRVDGLTRGSWNLQVRGPGGAETIVPDLVAGTEHVVVTLRPASGIEGTLVGYEDSPPVYARPLDASRLMPGQVDGAHFRLALPAGTWVVSAMNAREGDVQRVEVRDGAFTRVTMTSRGQAVVTGSVVEHLTHAPVPDLVCHVVVASAGLPGITNWDLETAPKTDASGAFSADPAPAGELHVGCEGDLREYSSASGWVSVAKGGRATVALEVVKRLAPDASGDVGVMFDETLSTPLVKTVRPTSPAALGGVAPGDVVVAVDGVPTAPLDASGVEALIGNHLPGTKLALTLMRGVQRREVTLTTTASQP